MPIALLDADIVAYRASVTAQDDIDWGDGEDGLTVSPEQAAETAVALARQWTTAAGCKKAICCFSGPNNFRKAVYPSYKSNRSGEKPEAYQAAVEALEAEFKVLREDRLEADDILGLMATSPKGNFVMVSIDKDLRSIPGYLFNPAKDKKPRLISAAQANQWFLVQTMCGDPTDGYPGIPGVGQKKAAEIITSPHRLLKKSHTVTKGKNAGKTKVQWVKGGPCSVWQSMLDHAAKAGMSEADLSQQAVVARILRHGEYDWDTKEIKLWKP